MDLRIGQQSFRRKKMTKQLTGKRDDSALHSAARAGNLAVTKEILVEVGGDETRDLLRKQNQSGETALYVASEYGYVDVVREMIKHYDASSAGIKARNGFDALHIAAKQGDVDVLQVLLEALPELSMTVDSTNTTALHTAATQGHAEVLKMLLAVNGDLAKIARSNGKTALHSAARNGRLEVVKALLNREHAITARKDKKGQTALHMAELLRCDPSLTNMVDSKGNTALHIAAMKGRDQVAKILLESEETDAGILNRAGDTALDIAEKAGHSELTTTLLNHGAQRARELGGAAAAAGTPAGELKQTVNDIQHEVHSQLERTFQTGERLQGIARRVSKLHADGLNNAINSTTVVAVLIATIAFAAIFTVPGKCLPGEANVAQETAFTVFFISDAVSLFISLAVVVVQTSVVVVEQRAKKRLMAVINKLMWLACVLISVSFLAVSFLVVGPAAIMAATLGTLCCWVVAHRAEERKLSRRRRRRRSSLSRSRSPSVSAVISDPTSQAANSSCTPYKIHTLLLLLLLPRHVHPQLWGPEYVRS
ncbi:unnamed protein product [Spirodela intermedia]|uniref:PGG domain-containing protein n=1 Tax=Spirodela intermedia TaxID=51605 RepID=A0A7I8IG19_SPIIN|nr:unnamed protein product [Spirodela intermedia]CAA6656850.1 unnamed protein product [Spirodela intermedia]